jgi:hypothetical protein
MPSGKTNAGLESHPAEAGMACVDHAERSQLRARTLAVHRVTTSASRTNRRYRPLPIMMTDVADGAGHHHVPTARVVRSAHRFDSDAPDHIRQRPTAPARTLPHRRSRAAGKRATRRRPRTATDPDEDEDESHARQEDKS